MKAIGLAALLLGTIAFLHPWFRQYLPYSSITRNETQLIAGLLVAVGALTLAVQMYRNRANQSK